MLERPKLLDRPKLLERLKLLERPTLLEISEFSGRQTSGVLTLPYENCRLWLPEAPKSGMNEFQ